MVKQEKDWPDNPLTDNPGRATYIALILFGVIMGYGWAVINSGDREYFHRTANAEAFEPRCMVMPPPA